MEQKLSIVIPVYNEDHLISQSLPAIFGLPINKEIIIVDDGSSDNTPALLAEMQKSYSFSLLRQNINQGKGAAIRRGLETISGDYFIIFDADLEYDTQDVIKMWQSVKDIPPGKNALYGSRFLNKPKLSFHYLVNNFLTRLTNLLFNAHLTDMETCLKLIPASALKDIALTCRRFEFEPEITAQLLKAGYTISETPIKYQRRSYAQGKKINARDGWEAIWSLIKEKLANHKKTG
jgi:glycosyltransferase involved in cell wall biosynthesis